MVENFSTKNHACGLHLDLFTRFDDESDVTLLIWNYPQLLLLCQEHVVQFVVKLLSPPVPLDYSGTKSHLVEYIPMLSAILSGASSIESVHILSLHGLVSEVYSMFIYFSFGFTNHSEEVYIVSFSNT